MTQQERYAAYLAALRGPFQKLCRLRFLQPDGSTAFVLDNNPRNPRAGAFLSDGTISGNWENGRRRSASVTLSNVDGAYDYNFNQVWFGTEIALDEGLVLLDGTDFYIQQGVFLIESPVENVRPGERTAQYSLVDKWARLDGALGGNLEGTYAVPEGTNIFAPIAALLKEPIDTMGLPQSQWGSLPPLDRVAPVFTGFYNGKTQVLPDGTAAALTDCPYDFEVSGDGGTKAEVILGLAGMVNAWVGYDETGALRLEPSQDDILDTDKPVLWEFSPAGTTLLGMAYNVKNTEVFNDYICVGELLDDQRQPYARAQIYDPRSPVNINAIGRKTMRVTASGFCTDTVCRDYAEWQVKRTSVLQRAVSISASQMFHLRMNQLVTIARTDKPGAPVERHLVQGFSRPLAGTGEMTVEAVSVQDFAAAEVASGYWQGDDA